MESNKKLAGYRVIVTGLVQGVGFRYFTSREANKLKLVGPAKNLNSGEVEVEMFGEQDQLQLLLKWLETGPETSTVDYIDVNEIAYIKKHGFLTI